MSPPPTRFIEDRALRDAARAVLEEDIARLRASLGEQGVASRVTSSVGSTVTSRIRAGASDVLEGAKQRASDNPGVLALLVGAILLWLMRGPLLALIEAQTDGGSDAQTDDNQTGEPGPGDDAEAPLADAGETA